MQSQLSVAQSPGKWQPSKTERKLLDKDYSILVNSTEKNIVVSLPTLTAKAEWALEEVVLEEV